MVIGIEEGWTKRVVDGIAKTGKPVTGFGIERTGDLMTVAKASRAAKDYLQWASELKREECDISDLWISTKCGESDTTTGLGSCPTVGNMYDKLIPKGIYGVFGETSEITGGEHIAKARAINPKIGEKWMKVWQAYEDEVIQAHKTDDLSELAADQGQHHRRAHNHRGKGARQSGEDRPHLPLYRRAGAGRGAAQGARALLHGHFVGGGRMRDADGGGRLRGAHVSRPARATSSAIRSCR